MPPYTISNSKKVHAYHTFTFDFVLLVFTAEYLIHTQSYIDE